MGMIDIYNVRNDSWTRIQSHIGRGVPASILLPDGRVLLISGETPWVDQNIFADSLGSNDARIPVIFDPETQEVSYEITSDFDVFRGYHNMASLLPDGRVVVGGGFNQYGDVGCENPNLRIFSPSYFDSQNRPSVESDIDQIALSQSTIIIEYKGPRLHAKKGVALLAAQAFTHSYGQNQRYVRLDIVKLTDRYVSVAVPSSPVLLLPGPYHLFLLSEEGTPSISIPVLVVRNDNDNSSSDNSRTLWVVFGVLTAAILLFVLVYITMVSQHGLVEEIDEEEEILRSSKYCRADSEASL